MNGDEVRRRRKALNLSQEQFAHRVGVTRQSVYMWERGKTPAPVMLDLALRYLELAARQTAGDWEDGLELDAEGGIIDHWAREDGA